MCFSECDYGSASASARALTHGCSAHAYTHTRTHAHVSLHRMSPGQVQLQMEGKQNMIKTIVTLRPQECVVLYSSRARAAPAAASKSTWPLPPDCEASALLLSLLRYSPSPSPSPRAWRGSLGIPSQPFSCPLPPTPPPSPERQGPRNHARRRRPCRPPPAPSRPLRPQTRRDRHLTFAPVRLGPPALPGSGRPLSGAAAALGLAQMHTSSRDTK